MQEAIAALAQWELVPADPVTPTDGLPAVTPEVEAGGARLSELLDMPADSVVYSPQSLQPVQMPGQGNKEMGTILMARLDGIGTEFKTNVGHAYDALEKSPEQFTLRDMMKLQMDMAVVTLEIEVVGKGVQKAVQHVDTLSKLQ
ncbi:MAG: Type secretion basal body protein YscI, HrpB, PscI [Pseudomonadota bacterium]